MLFFFNRMNEIHLARHYNRYNFLQTSLRGLRNVDTSDVIFVAAYRNYKSAARECIPSISGPAVTRKPPS